MIKYSITKKQFTKMCDMVFCKQLAFFFSVMIMAFGFSLITLIIILACKKDNMWDYFNKGIGVFITVGVITLLAWLHYRYVLNKKFGSLKNNEAFESGIEFTNDKVTLYNLRSGDVRNYVLAEVKHFYENKDFIVLAMKYQEVMPILKNDDTKEIVDYIKNNFMKVR